MATSSSTPSKSSVLEVQEVSPQLGAPAAKPQTSKVPVSCTKAFDSLYYCYSPFFQGRQYYRNGELDNCRGRVRRFRLCLLSRLKPHSEAERIFLEEEERIRKMQNLDNVSPVWEMREEYLENVARSEQQSDQPNDSSNNSEKESWWL